MEQEYTGATGEPEKTEGFAQNVTGEQVQFGPGFAVSVQGGQDVEITKAGALAAVAGRDMDVSFGGALVQVAGGDMQVTNGGAEMMIVGGDVTMQNGGAQVMLTGGNISLTNGGGLLLAGQEVTAQQGFFGIVLTPNMNLGEGSKVLLDTKQAAIFGAAFGVVFGLLSLVFRHK